MRRWALLVLVWVSWITRGQDICDDKSVEDPYTGREIKREKVCKPTVSYRIKSFPTGHEAAIFISRAPKSVSGFMFEKNPTRPKGFFFPDYERYNYLDCRKGHEICREAQ